MFEETPTEGDREMYGIGGSSKFWKSAITLKLAGEWIPVSCILMEHDDIPFIRGRLDIFGKFNIKFDGMELRIEQRNG